MEALSSLPFLIRQTTEVLLDQWYIGASLLALVALAIVVFLIKRPPLFKHYLFALSPLALPVLSLLLGSLFFRPPQMIGEWPKWPSYAVYVLFFANIPLGIGLAFALPRIWWVIGAITAFSLWLSFWASFIAGMAITGVWP